MSTSVAHPGTTPRSGRSGAVVGMAAVALAAVIAIGFVVAGNQAGDNAVTDIQRAHPQVSDASIARREWLKEQAALNAQPSVNPDIMRAEQYQEFLEGRAQQAAAARTTSPEMHRANGYAGSVGNVAAGSATVNPEVEQAQAYLDFLNSRAQGLDGMWDQRNNDLVERFENQFNGGNGLTPLQGRF